MQLSLTRDMTAMCSSQQSPRRALRPSSRLVATDSGRASSIGSGTKRATWLSDSSTGSNNFVASRHATTNSPTASTLSCIWLAPISGYCEHALEDICSSGKKYDSILDVINYSGLYLGMIVIFAFFVFSPVPHMDRIAPRFFDFLLSNSPIISKLLLGLCLLGTTGALFTSFLKKTISYKIPSELESS